MMTVHLDAASIHHYAIERNLVSRFSNCTMNVHAVSEASQHIATIDELQWIPGSTPLFIDRTTEFDYHGMKVRINHWKVTENVVEPGL